MKERLKTILLVLGALALILVPAASAAVGDPVILGQINDSGNQTTAIGGAVDNTRLVLVSNTGTNGIGLEASGEWIGLRGASTYGSGVKGFSFYGEGVGGSSVHGYGLGAGSSYGVGLWAGGGSGGIQAWSWDTIGAFPGVRSHSDVATGVLGVSQISFAYLFRAPGTGVLGVGTKGGVRGEVRDEAGDISADGIGVLGTSGVASSPIEEGIGVRGEGSSTGVHGRSDNGTGVKAESANGTALEVVGKASFSITGTGVIDKNTNSAVIADPNVTVDSIILVTLTSDPGNPMASVQWFERNPGVGFTLHLAARVRNPTTFSYIILEPRS